MLRLTQALVDEALCQIGPGGPGQVHPEPAQAVDQTGVDANG